MPAIRSITGNHAESFKGIEKKPAEEGVLGPAVPMDFGTVLVVAGFPVEGMRTDGSG